MSKRVCCVHPPRLIKHRTSQTAPAGAAADAVLAWLESVQQEAPGAVVVAPNFASQATNWALDNYSGPGMTLVVKRGGQEVEVPLE